MHLYTESLTSYRRLPTREVRIGDLLLGNFHPIRLQTMTTTDTMDTAGTVAQTIRCIEAGAELVRITAPSKKEAENLLNIRNELRRQGYTTPLVADIHFTPNAAEIAARIVEKVRINPGNYVDKKKFETLEYTDAEYAEEIDRIRERFVPLLRICKEHGTAMRIGTNHGSLSDRIMSRYGDTPMGMVESALEFLRIARDEGFHNLLLSMKSSNPQVMVQAYRLLVHQMQGEFGECYPLHLGVTEAGDGEDGRIKSAVGIGTLLEDGLGDTVRVSLTEDPELEIPVCRDLVARYTSRPDVGAVPPLERTPWDPFAYRRRDSFAVENIGGGQVPAVVADLSKIDGLTPDHLIPVGYTYDAATDKWSIGDAAADYIFTGHQVLPFALPGTLRVLVYPATWSALLMGGTVPDPEAYVPIFSDSGFAAAFIRHPKVNFVMVDCYEKAHSPQSTVYSDTPEDRGPSTVDALSPFLETFANDPSVVICLSSVLPNAMQAVRRGFAALMEGGVRNPVVIIVDSDGARPDEHLIHYSAEAGALLLDGLGDGICLGMTEPAYRTSAAAAAAVSGRNYQQATTVEGFINNTAFSLLQATRTRISKTEYISCPSCGRTLFDLQETTAKIRSVTHHLKGVKIAIMGCIVNGPGEMADADFGYVGSGPGKITLYRGKEVVKRNVPSEVAVEELIGLLKDNGAWVERGVS